MFRQILLVCFLSISAVVFGQEKINDANAEPRTIGAFTALKVSNAFDVYLIQSNEAGLAVSASEKEYREDIHTYVSGNVLHIEFKGDRKFWKGNNKLKLKAYVSFRDLESLDVSGACNVIGLNKITLNKIKIHLSGASDLKADMDVKDMVVNISGASDMTIKGNASNVNVDASGASDFKGFDLVVDNCQADASGASNIRITVNKELNVRASGASDIDYKGTAVIRDLKTSGASNIKKRS